MPEARLHHSRWRRVRHILAWCLAIPCLLAAVPWMISGSRWELDLIASGNAQMLLASIVILAIVVALRSLWAAGAVVLACVLLAMPLAMGRAAWWPTAASSPGEPLPSDTIRVLHYNDSTRSKPEEVDRLLMWADADIVHLLAPPVHTQFKYIYGKGKLPGYMGQANRKWSASGSGGGMVSAAVVWSRWPLTTLDTSAAGKLHDRFICELVDRPQGRFVLMCIHPRSPRNSERWHEGNELVRALNTLVAQFRLQGLPVLVLTDFNGTPSGYRAALVRQAGELRRAKPWLTPRGTHPLQVNMDVLDTMPAQDKAAAEALAAVPPDIQLPPPKRVTDWSTRWPLTVAIDDALLSREFSVSGWTALDLLNSEHNPILMDLRLNLETPGSPGKSP